MHKELRREDGVGRAFIQARGGSGRRGGLEMSHLFELWMMEKEGEVLRID